MKTTGPPVRKRDQPHPPPGEDFATLQAAEKSGELSPLARGGPKSATARFAGSRAIPAGAGRTTWRTRSGTRCASYPRWRGEDVRIEHDGQPGVRAIPAGAGRTQAFNNSRPQSCELSPLARGGPANRALQHTWSRAIPAGAGRTLAAYACTASPGELSPLARGG